ncbi:MAG: hypothetical protein U1E33_08100 [Rhodospirillales bacterium]
MVSPNRLNSFAADGYSEDYFRSYLGAKDVTSFDASAYQNATVIHDFNRPLPEAYHAAFDAVVDGGTLDTSSTFARCCGTT